MQLEFDFPKPSEYTLGCLILGAGGALCVVLFPISILLDKVSTPLSTFFLIMPFFTTFAGLLWLLFYTIRGEAWVKFQLQIDAFARDVYGLELSHMQLWRMSFRRNLSPGTYAPKMGPDDEFHGYWAVARAQNGSKVRLVLDVDAAGNATLSRKKGLWDLMDDNTPLQPRR